MNVTNMVQGNLALKLETPAEPTFTVVQGGRSGFQPLTVKPAQTSLAQRSPLCWVIIFSTENHAHFEPFTVFLCYQSAGYWKNSVFGLVRMFGLD